MSRILFILPDLGQSEVNVNAVRDGNVALSGSRSSWLYVLEGLAKAGMPIASLVLSGDRLDGTQSRVVAGLDEGLDWVRDGIVLYCSWGDWEGVPLLASRHVRPWVWLHTYLAPTYLDALDEGKIEAIIVPSDTSRLHGLRRSSACRLGRIYNPIGEHFLKHPTYERARYRSKQMVFSGAIDEHKGAHRVLQVWPTIRRRIPGARLVLAGSSRLYCNTREQGPLGVAGKAFESQYIAPLAKEFGSFDEAGVRFSGLLKPNELASLYRESAIGISNLNWRDNVETFGCGVAEMIGTGLPVVGFARGALPETAGPTGAACLVDANNPCLLAERIAQLLKNPEKLADLGATGARYVAREYSTERIVSNWCNFLGCPPMHLSRAVGRWQKPDGVVRYSIESWAGKMQCGWLLDTMQWFTGFGRSED